MATDATLHSVCTEVLNSLGVAESDININKVKLSVAVLSQEGATSPKFKEGRMCSLFGINVTFSILRKACGKNSTTVRAIARSLRKEALDVAFNFGIEGNLSKSYKLDNPDANISDLIWVSDFQSFSNDPAMPDHVRHWLLNNYSKRFNKP